MMSLVNNVSALTAQNNMARNNMALGKSLERLSTGLKINRGADGPASLVISEQQRAQISGLRTAQDNTQKAIAMVQTAEGGLNVINKLLGKARSLALDSANTGVNDANALAANQAEVKNILKTISNVANTSKFGTKNLLNGQAGVTGTVTGANNGALGAIKTGVNAGEGAKSVVITTAGTGGDVVASAAGTGASTAGGSLTISGGGLTTGQNLTVAIAAGDNAAATVTKIQEALDKAQAVGGGAGKFTVDLTGGNEIRIRSNVLGSDAITVFSDSADTASVTGFATGLGDTGTAGVDLEVEIDGQAATVVAGSNGLNNQVTFGGDEGISFSVGIGITGSSYNPGVEFQIATARTKPSGLTPYKAEITSLASRASTTATNALALSTVIDNSNNTLGFLINGVSKTLLTLTNGTYTPETLASMLQQTINTNSNLSNNLAVVGLDAGKLTFTSQLFGSGSKIAFDGGSALAALGLTGGETATGTNVAGRFVVNGQVEAATGSGQRLIGNADNPNTEGLQVQVGLTSPGTANITVSQGLAGRVNDVLAKYLDVSSGRLPAAVGEFNSQIDDIQSTIDQQNKVITEQTERLTLQLARMETAISQFRGFGDQIASLVPRTSTR
jgi:flagellin